MKVTNKQLLLFRANADVYNKSLKGKKNKLSWAIKKMVDRTQKDAEKYQEAVEDIRVELAGKDDKGFLIEDDEGNFKFKPEDLKKLKDKVKKLQEEEVEIEPYLASEVPEDLHFSFYEVFSPFVLKELTEDEIEELFMKS